MQTYVINPSMKKVASSSEEFLKKSHRIMQEKGFKVETDVSDEAAMWIYTSPNGVVVYMPGWSGKSPKRYGSVKTVHGIDIDIAGKNPWYHYRKLEFKIIDLIPEVLDSRYNWSDELIEMYSKKLEEALEYLENIESHISSIA